MTLLYCDGMYIVERLLKNEPSKPIERSLYKSHAENVLSNDRFEEPTISNDRYSKIDDRFPSLAFAVLPNTK